MPELRGGPEAALQLLADALRARHNPPPGKRAAPTNGWTAADELELIMRRWRALLVGGKMGEITVGKRKADACKKHSQRLNKYLHENIPSRVVEDIWNVTAAQLSPDPVRVAVMDCTDPDESKRSAALKARMERRRDDDSPRPERRPRAPVRRRATGVHTAMGFAFYLADVMSILTADSEPGGEKRRRYVLVRSDHVAADMDWVRAWAGLPPATGAFPHKRSTYPAHNRTELSTAGRASLKAHLRADYDVLARLQPWTPLTRP